VGFGKLTVRFKANFTENHRRLPEITGTPEYRKSTEINGLRRK
jgi:hypothetical protein